MSRWWGTRSLFKLLVDEGLTVVRMLAYIARHCSDLIVFVMIFALRSDSFLVDGLKSAVYVARRSV